MGLTFDNEAIRGVRRKKGVFSGCDVTKDGVDPAELDMSAGRVKFGLVAADLTALGKQQLNEGGAEKTVAAAVFSVAALDDGTHTLYLKTDGTLAVTPEAGVALNDGPMMLANDPGLTTSPNVEVLRSPSILLCSFQVDTGEVVDDSISYLRRETAL